MADNIQEKLDAIEKAVSAGFTQIGMVQSDILEFLQEDEQHLRDVIVAKLSNIEGRQAILECKLDAILAALEEPPVPVSGLFYLDPSEPQ
jgi:hypothetical protein